MEDPRRFFKGSCHCGSVRYLVRMTPTHLPLYKGERIYRCNCTICHKIGHLHLRPASAVADFILLSPIDPFESLGDYLCDSKDLHFFFCKTCAIRPFIFAGKGQIVDMDLDKLNIDGVSNVNGQKNTKVWTVAVEDDHTYLCINGNTVDALQDGYDPRDYVEKKSLVFIDWLNDRDAKQNDRPHPGGCY